MGLAHLPLPSAEVAPETASVAELLAVAKMVNAWDSRVTRLVTFIKTVAAVSAVPTVYGIPIPSRETANPKNNAISLINNESWS